MKLYKLTDKNGYTRAGEENALKWAVGVTHSATGVGVRLCSADVIHAYTDPVLAVLMNPTHANIENPLFWECEGDVVASDGCKVGVKKLSITAPHPVPDVSTETRIRFGIACAWLVTPSAVWREWAANWVSGKDRSEKTARAADAAVYAVYAAADATAYAAADAAHAAARDTPSQQEALITRALAWAQTTEGLDTLGELE